MTELTWEGKYDQDNRRVAPLRVSLPFQTVETVKEMLALMLMQPAGAGLLRSKPEILWDQYPTL